MNGLAAIVSLCSFAAALILFIAGDAVVADNNMSTLGSHDTVGANKDKFWLDVASGACVLVAAISGSFAIHGTDA